MGSGAAVRLEIICELEGFSASLGQFQRPLSLSELSASIQSLYGRQLDMKFTLPCGSVQPISNQQDLNLVETINADHYEQEAGTLRLLLTELAPTEVLIPAGEVAAITVDLGKCPLLGQGSFGKVFKCEDLNTGRIYAVKVVELNSHSLESQAVRYLEQEIRLLRAIEHPRIVKYFDCRREPHRLCIFMEFMPENSLRQYIRARGTLNEKVAMRFTRMVTEGLHFLHSRGIIHRDVKAANILKDSRGKVKLSDFGAAKRIQEIGSSHSVTGTVFYMSPEMIGGEARVDCKTDIWSLGATVVEFLTGRPPYHDCDNPAAVVLRIMNHPENFSMPQAASEVARDFIRACFTRPAAVRPSAEELLRSHPFLPPLDDSPPL